MKKGAGGLEKWREAPFFKASSSPFHPFLTLSLFHPSYPFPSLSFSSLHQQLLERSHPPVVEICKVEHIQYIHTEYTLCIHHVYALCVYGKWKICAMDVCILCL